MNSDELSRIVFGSIVNNEAAGVTGMLWSTETHFAQVLEGEHDAVGGVMARIARDARHRDISVVADRTVSRRLFGEWSMARANDVPESVDGTVFLVGFALGERSAAARELYDIVVASDD